MANRFDKAFTLASVARCFGAAGGNWDQAAHVAKSDYAWNKATVEVTKAAASGLATSDMANTYSYGGMIDSFVESIRPFSPFDAMKSSMREMPFSTTIYGTTGVTGQTVAEGQWVPVSEINLTDAALLRRKGQAIVVMSIAAFQTAGFLPHLQRELGVATASATNRDFLAELADAAASETASGSTAAHVLEDLEKMAGHIRKRGTSALFLIVGPDTAANLACKHVGGLPAFADVGPNGGSLAGIPVLVSDELPADSDGHNVLLVDADAIIYGDEGIRIEKSLAATVRMSGDPENDIAPATISLFQTDSIALLVSRHFGHKLMREDAVAVLRNVAW